MTPHEAIGYDLLQASAITAIVSTRVYHALRPEGTALPAINFYALDALRYNGIESAAYSINCRAHTPAAAHALARLVVTLFGGADGNGTYGAVNTFAIARASVKSEQPLIIEPDNDTFNCPVDIQIVYRTASVT